MYDVLRPGIVVESPKRGGFHAWTDLERIAQPRFGGPPKIFFTSPKVYKLF